MLTGPIVIGIMVGIIIILPTIWFKKKTKSKILIFAPCIISFVAGIYVMYLGYVVIRGFEGGAHMILAVFILITSFISFSIARRRSVNS